MTLVLIAAVEQALSGSNFPNVALRQEIWRDDSGSGVDAGANEEDVYGKVMLVRRGSGGTGSFNLNGVCSASATVNGGTVYAASGLNYDFRTSSGMGSPGATQMLWEGWVTVPHDSDGTKVNMPFAASWTGDSNLGSRSISGTVTLPKITLTPVVPSSVAAVRVSDTEATLSWVQSNPGHGQPTANEYRSRVNGGAWSSVTSISPTTSVAVTTAANQKVEFQVRASNAGGTSDWSSTSAPIYTTPAAPTSVAAVKDASLNIDISWTPNVGFAEHEHVIEHSADGGAYAALTVVASGTTTYEDVTPNPAQTHRYRVRARNTSGALTSAWVESATVQLLVAPNKPTVPDLPDFAAAGATFRLPWVHNPVDTTAQTKYQWRWSTNGGSSWTTGSKTVSANQFHDFAGGTWTADQAVTFQVRTKGQYDSGSDGDASYSPWSDAQTVTFKTAPVATITSPADASTYEQAELVVTVGFAQAEGATFVQATAVLNDGVDDLETVVSGSQTLVFETPVENGGAYTVTVTVLDSNGVTSAEVESDFSVSYTLPVQAEVELVWLVESGWTQINVTIPEAGSGEEPAVSVTITRTIDGVSETLWSEYPTTVGDSFIDTTPHTRAENVYLVRTHSADGAINDTTESLVTDEADWAYLSTGPGFQDVVAFRSNLEFGSTPGRATDLFVAAGRSKPIALFGEQTSYVVAGSAMLSADEGSTPQEVDEFLREPTLVCYRDPFPRRMFGTVSGSVASPSSIFSEFSYQVVEAT